MKTPWHHLDDFTRGYIETALWSATYNDGEREDRPMDDDFDYPDIADSTAERMIQDCAGFQAGPEFLEAYNAGAVDDLERAGGDFWLTRNGHGAGYWDGDYPAPWGRRLTDAAKAYGTVDLFATKGGQVDDGQA